MYRATRLFLAMCLDNIDDGTWATEHPWMYKPQNNPDQHLSQEQYEEKVERMKAMVCHTKSMVKDLLTRTEGRAYKNARKFASEHCLLWDGYI